MGYTQAQLNEARAFDAKLARDRHKLTPFKGGRLTRQLSVTAIFQMYRDCPPGIATAADRKKYLEENERLYLDFNTQKSVGFLTRHGRASVKTVYHKDGTKEEFRAGPLSSDRAIPKRNRRAQWQKK